MTKMKMAFCSLPVVASLGIRGAFTCLAKQGPNVNSNCTSSWAAILHMSLKKHGHLTRIRNCVKYNFDT
jgi:hypothetical protein